MLLRQQNKSHSIKMIRIFYFWVRINDLRTQTQQYCNHFFHSTMIYPLQFRFFGSMKSVTFYLYTNVQNTLFFLHCYNNSTQNTLSIKPQNKIKVHSAAMIWLECKHVDEITKKYTYTLLTNFCSEFVLHNWHTVLG